MCEAASNTPASRDEILKLLDSHISANTTYHNHKETSAWAGTALYSVFINSTAINASALWQNYPRTATATIIFISFIITFYLKTQFRLRKIGGDVASACVHLKNKIVSEPGTVLNADDYASESATNEIPKAVNIKIKQLNEYCDCKRITLELCAYGIVFSSLAISLLIIWK